jgi:hypothetical protein
MNETAVLICELRERAAFYFDRPSVPVMQYPSPKEISVTEARNLSDLFRRAAAELERLMRA